MWCKVFKPQSSCIILQNLAQKSLGGRIKRKTVLLKYMKSAQYLSNENLININNQWNSLPAIANL